ncbi:RdgB/HAM1 family non-canonical purine NTP pyrophosphatase [Haliangium ochraceum]|uniref:dITP/XTP pyrophosphatase n=1 Tax=Haliangium ochraceum (strain DSM 14365 / JCM 11303 / SMP-2) TaxID=502025 RepID=D0LLI9_HALO1|nr:RdgB/HAM1 family non-canonical purine NTP pyrophosphatase [Haliangium ochraceum]ACY13206.1 non-canonical purine NTP pyrophosphatase, rdgB/HAM1 family [Haliangium ochraceum DSM 14365]
MSGAKQVLVFATRNRGKLEELRQLLAGLAIEVKAVDEWGGEVPEVEEDGDTFAANAAKKAREVSAATGLPALADDSGLEVDVLDGAPGVRSARYSGEGASDEANNRALLAALAGEPAERRGARFRACLALADEGGGLAGEVILEEGACEGRILEAPRGSGGFGYDPLFFSEELGATFAELGIGTKNGASHRARAMQAMKPRIAAYFRLAGPESSG